MDDIYSMLSKHFHGEASPEEEIEIAKFIRENEMEYQALAQFWRKGEISIKEFNSKKAWKEVTATQTSRSINLYRLIKRAAVAAVFVLGVLAIYFYREGSSAHSFELITLNNAGAEVKLVQLSDGTKVWLNKTATLSYPKEFTGVERKVNLTGEAFFEVTPNSKRPFMVSTGHSNVVVLGTSFNVSATSSQTEVSVVSGKVKVSSLSKPGNNVVLLPNYTAVSTNQTLTSHINHKANYLSWKTGVFVFDNTPISQVISDLNTYYTEQISIIDSGHAACRLKAKFNQATISEIIEIITSTCDVELKINSEKTNITQE